MKKVGMFLEESSRHMAQALSKSRVTISCQDLALRYLWVFNPVEGFAMEIGKTLEDSGEDNTARLINPLKHKVLLDKTPHQQTVSLTVGDEKRTFDMTVTPTFDGDKMIGLTTISVDISDLLSAQEELHQAHARLLGLIGDNVIGGRIHTGRS